MIIRKSDALAFAGTSDYVMSAEISANVISVRERRC